jgi:hypothetical protein
VSDTRARIIDMLERRGRPAPLRRRVGTTSSFTDVTVDVVSAGYQPQELVGTILQGDRKAVISNDEIEAASWPGPPRKGDLLVLDGVSTTIQTSVAMYDKLGIIAYILQVRG